jgi:hypothetical protein
MEVAITIQGENLEPYHAAKQLRLLAKMIEHGTVHSEGFNIEYMGEYHLDIDLGSAFPHGDYQDAEGNLLHIHNDVVVNVTWASKNAEVEDVEISAYEWAKEHGAIRRAGEAEGGESEGHTHE